MNYSKLTGFFGTTWRPRDFYCDMVPHLRLGCNRSAMNGRYNNVGERAAP